MSPRKLIFNSTGKRHNTLQKTLALKKIWILHHFQRLLFFFDLFSLSFHLFPLASLLLVDYLSPVLNNGRERRTLTKFHSKLIIQSHRTTYLKRRSEQRLVTSLFHQNLRNKWWGKHGAGTKNWIPLPTIPSSCFSFRPGLNVTSRTSLGQTEPILQNEE